jgi:hypothetical protein
VYESESLPPSSSATETDPLHATGAPYLHDRHRRQRRGGFSAALDATEPSRSGVYDAPDPYPSAPIGGGADQGAFEVRGRREPLELTLVEGPWLGELELVQPPRGTFLLREKARFGEDESKGHRPLFFAQ